MSKISRIHIGLIGLGVLLMVGGDRLAVPALLHAGLAVIGLGFIVGGGAAIVTRQYTLPLRKASEATYYGLGAMLYGTVLVWIGVWILSIAGILILDVGQAVFRSVIRRPGFVLVNVAFMMLASGAVVLTSLAGSQSSQGTGRFLNLIQTVFNSIPALILTVLGLALLGLGVLEIVSPATFDQMGGGFLEILFQEPS
jgi:hypothetical protein